MTVNKACDCSAYGFVRYDPLYLKCWAKLARSSKNAKFQLTFGKFTTLVYVHSDCGLIIYL